jgi:predicted RNA-binding Zn-ribbon protein involved in translation (DUF1610 family)
LATALFAVPPGIVIIGTSEGIGLLLEEGIEARETGAYAAVGSLVCVGCGYSLSLSVDDELPQCPACGETQFRRASMFGSQTVDAEAIAPASSPPAWLEGIRAELDPGGRFVAFEEDGEHVVIELRAGWTRIGRSDAADIQLDDATVSRRHALIVRTPEDKLRALDDRSLNGLFVNGERVEWTPLAEGDELEIGRYRLYVLQA